MQTLIDLLPLIFFYAAYQYGGMPLAIPVIMAAVAIQVAVTWVLTRTVHKLTLGSAVLVVVLGGASLLVQSPTVFKWKPTILFWVMAVIFLCSHFIGSKTVAQRFWQSAAKEDIVVAEREWRTINLAWVLFLLCIGALNLYVAYGFRENVWVNFKLFGLTAIWLLFTLAQAAWLFRHQVPATVEGDGKS
jgi:intracellular septation protein